MPAKLWADFERLTASDLNTYLSRQVLAVFASAAARDSAIPAPVDGQAAYLTDSDTLTVYDGSAWRVLARRPAAAQLEATGNQSIATATSTKITLATVVEDFGGFALGNSELTVPAGLAGLYELSAALYWASQSTVVGYRDLQILVGAALRVRVLGSQATASIAHIQTASGVVRLAAGDVVSLWAGHTHGSSINSTRDAGFAPRLSIVRLGD